IKCCNCLFPNTRARRSGAAPAVPITTFFADDGSDRIRSLRDPAKKMSKSDTDPKSRILLSDTDDEIRVKIKKAVTDFTPELCNLYCRVLLNIRVGCSAGMATHTCKRSQQGTKSMSR
ncbi:jg400, partial [Pararge aegeria aegeria]